MSKTNYKWDLSKEEQTRKDNKALLEDLKVVLIGILCLFVAFVLWEFLHFLAVFTKSFK